ncbi:hypothetical protein D9M69_412650 [compost metagenome]
MFRPIMQSPRMSLAWSVTSQGRAIEGRKYKNRQSMLVKKTGEARLFQWDLMNTERQSAADIAAAN